MRRALGIIPTLLFASLCFAAQPDRITGTIDSYRAVVLPGSVHAEAQPQFDQGPVEASFNLPYITMVMQPSAKQQADLQQLLEQQQDPASPNYHKWLTPEQYANRFGVSQKDVEKVTAWLRSQGFSIVQAARGRNWIAFTGTAELVESTFHTQIHYFNVDGEQHFANATEISIPQALAGIVIGFHGLNDFSLKPMGIREPGPADFFPLIVRPQYDLLGSHFLAPDDIATIYDITPLYNSTPPIDGTGMKMVVVGQVDVSASLSDIDNFRSAFGLAKNDPQQTIVPGSPNPGTDPGDMGESKLDLEWAGAVARNATILFITANKTASGVFGAAQYAIDNNLAPVISMSYGACESLNAPLASLEVELQKANSEGITFLASSGDTGAAGCDAGTEKVATLGLAVNYPASSPEVTGVGGNEFNEGSGTYWNTSNGTNGGSALSYIPEMAWNDTILNTTLSASGGGASSCGTAPSNTCAGGFGFPKPSWQTGTGVPNDGVRDVPDVAMTASADHDGYIICDSQSCASGIGTSPMIVGGTSASTPVFAGIVTLLVQSGGGSGLGNINSKLYSLAQNSSNGVFHDVTTGSNIVPCTPGTPSTDLPALQCPSSGQFGYNAGRGYDQVTGLGSVDANAFVKNFSGTAATTTTILASSANPASFGTTVTFTATVTGSNTPTGIANFNNGATTLGSGTISSGQATFTTSTLAVGALAISAAYGGDTKNAPSTSALLTQTITAVGGQSTSTVVTSNLNPATYGAPVTFTATVTTTNSVPANTVTFQDGTTPLGFANVNPATTNSGTATFIIPSLTGGTHSIKGLYSGDSTNASSTSTVVSQVINKASTTTAAPALSSSSVNVKSSGPVTMTAAVTPAAGPTGSINFLVDGTLVGSASVGGSFNYNPSGLTAGNHSITAAYQGDQNFSSSATSPATTLFVQDFTIAANPTTATVSAPGQIGTTTLTITPVGGFNQTLSYACTGLPSEATCTFASAAANSETVTISTTAASRLWEGPFGRRGSIFYAVLLPGLMGLVLPTSSRKRSWRGLLSLLVVLAVLILWMPACGGGSGGGGPTNPGTPTGSSTVTITASTSGTGALSHTVTITLNVQ